MPLNFVKESLQKHKGLVENGFWILVLAIAYIAMQKVMHPGWKIFGF